EREREYFGSSLNGMKYKEVKLEDICDKLFAGGDVPQNQWSKEKTAEYKVPIYSNGIEEKSLYGFTNIAKVKEDALTISGRGTIGYVTLRKAPFYPIIRLIVAIPNTNKVHLEYLKFALQSVEIIGNGNTIPQLTVPMIKRIKIPLPSLAEQEKIVAQFNEEQEIIEANKKLIEIMKKKIERVMERII
ncbi:MAG: restriction endonuclease subunit S, partial [Fibromonadales bacterium]|nr:restriction endonuclease subunit S [Fibromonadales bacterium]